MKRTKKEMKMYDEGYNAGYGVGFLCGNKATAKAIFEELEKKKANTNQGSLVVFWTSIEDLKEKFLKEEKPEVKNE